MSNRGSRKPGFTLLWLIAATTYRKSSYPHLSVLLGAAFAQIRHVCWDVLGDRGRGGCQWLCWLSSNIKHGFLGLLLVRTAACKSFMRPHSTLPQGLGSCLSVCPWWWCCCQSLLEISPLTLLSFCVLLWWWRMCGILAVQSRQITRDRVHAGRVQVKPCAYWQGRNMGCKNSDIFKQKTFLQASKCSLCICKDM